MPKINDKKIRYVSIDPTAFLFDADFMSLDFFERGFYLTMLFYLFSSNGRIPNDMAKLRRLTGIYKFPGISSEYRTCSLRITRISPASMLQMHWKELDRYPKCNPQKA